MEIIPKIRTVRLDPPKSVGPGKKSNILILPGDTHLRTHLQLLGGLTKDKITDIALKMKGDIARSLGSGTDLDRINSYMKRQSSADVLTIYHTRERVSKFTPMHATALGMLSEGKKTDLTSVEIIVTLDGTAPANSDIEVFGEVTDPSVTNFYQKEELMDFEFTTNGEKILSNIFQGDEEVMELLAIEYTNCAVDLVKVRYEDEIEFERPSAIEAHIKADSDFVASQSGLWVFDKAERGFGKEPVIYRRNGRFALMPTISSVTGTATLRVRKRTIEKWRG